MKYSTDCFCNEIKVRNQSVMKLGNGWTVDQVEIDNVLPCDWITVHIRRTSQANANRLVFTPNIEHYNNGSIKINGGD